MRLIFNRLFLVIGLFFTSSYLFASDNLTVGSGDSSSVTLNVYGTTACKSTIETISKSLSNVSSASFNGETHTLTLVVLPEFDPNDLFFLLASKGYDAGNVRAKDTIYNQLPDECKYVRMPDEVVRD
jgi:hypothetical protein